MNTQLYPSKLNMTTPYSSHIYTAVNILRSFIDRNSCNCVCHSQSVPCRRIPLNLANHTNALVYLSSAIYPALPYLVDLPSHTLFLPYHLRYPLHLTEVVPTQCHLLTSYPACISFGTANLIRVLTISILKLDYAACRCAPAQP